MTTVNNIIATCFNRFNELSTTNVGFDGTLIPKCHNLRVRDDVCYSARTGRPFNVNGITAKWFESGEVKFYHSDVVIHTLPPVGGFRNAVFGHFLHALENTTINVLTFHNLMKLMAGIVEDVISEAAAGKLEFITVQRLLEDVEFLHSARSFLTYRLDETVIKCTDVAKFAGDY